MNNAQGKEGSSKILPILGALAGVLTAVGTVIAALAAVGVFEDDQPQQTTVTQQAAPGTNDEASPLTTQTTTPTTVGASAAPTAPPETETGPERTTVTIAYLGDADGCVLSISVAIGDQTVTPTGTSFQMNDVLTGAQNYRIGGTISCPTVGGCDASGSGTVPVEPGRTFYVQWQNVAFASCDIFLNTI